MKLGLPWDFYIGTLALWIRRTLQGNWVSLGCDFLIEILALQIRRALQESWVSLGCGRPAASHTQLTGTFFVSQFSPPLSGEKKSHVAF